MIREFKLVPAGEAQVVFLDAPPEPAADKKIHDRRFLPIVPEKSEDTEESK